MNILKTREGGKLTVALEGRLDTTTAPQLETELRAALDGAGHASVALYTAPADGDLELEIVPCFASRLSASGS